MHITESYHDSPITPDIRCEHVNPILNIILDSDAIFIAPISLYRTLDASLFGCIFDLKKKATDAKKIALVYNSIYYTSPESKWLEGVIRSCIETQS